MDFGTKLDQLIAVKLQQIKVDAIEQCKDEYIDQQKEQLFAGKKQDQTSITPPYAPLTIRLKSGKGQPTDRVTLKDKEDFYNRIFLDVRMTEIAADSIDSKSQSLQKRYGEKIFIIGGQYKGQFITVLQPVFLQKVKDACAL